MARLVSNLTKIADTAPAAANAALLQTGADIVAIVKQLAPVDTGALRQSYGAVPVSPTEVQIGSDMPYAPYQEFGTSQMGAQPHLTPAMQQAEVTFKSRLAEEMRKIT